jgi:predicted RNA-binding Zn ribbon-like protein
MLLGSVLVPASSNSADLVISTSVDPESLPILGEPFAVEFANTRYDRPGSPRDYLSSDWIAAWFDLVANGSIPPLPATLAAADADRIRSIRDAIRTVLAETADGRTAPLAAVDTLNDAAGLVPWRLRLDWHAGAASVMDALPIGSGIDAVLASLARECLVFLSSPARELVRCCDDPDCPMFYVKQHHARRFCSDGCAHRMRQSRYYRRSRPAEHVGGTR